MTRMRLVLSVTIALLALRGVPAIAADGQAVYDAVCRVCHGSGIAGSPRLGDRAAWNLRLQRGIPALYATALSGKGGMPPKGGRMDLADVDVRAAVDFMLRASVGEVPSAASAAPGPTPRPTPQGAAGKGRENAPVASVGVAAAPRIDGARIYQATCGVCHESGLAGAPRFGDAAVWKTRYKQGIDALYQSALRGKLAMPARGGNAQLSDLQVRAAVDFMLQRVGLSTGSTRSVVASTAAGAGAAPAAAAARAPAPVAPPSALTGASASAVVAATPAAPLAATGGDPNAFNRLLRVAQGRYQPPVSDGIHDPENDGTLLLQAPEQALAKLPKRTGSGDVDWVRALTAAGLMPRADIQDPNAQMVVLDLNIVREVKGSMPDVVYPHEAHTRWLDCSNCHPAIFVPQKGANQISMAAIMLGQKCGVCHGSVAFPVSECRRCHSRDKPSATETKP